MIDIAQLEKEINDFHANILASTELLSCLGSTKARIALPILSEIKLYSLFSILSFLAGKLRRLSLLEATSFFVFRK